MPNVVLAYQFGAVEEYSYNKWLNEVNEKSEYKTVIETVVKDKIKNDIYYGIKDSKEQEDRTAKLLKDRGDHLIIKGKLYTKVEYEISSTDFKIEK